MLQPLHGNSISRHNPSSLQHTNISQIESISSFLNTNKSTMDSLCIGTIYIPLLKWKLKIYKQKVELFFITKQQWDTRRILLNTHPDDSTTVRFLTFCVKVMAINISSEIIEINDIVKLFVNIYCITPNTNLYFFIVFPT